MNRSAQPPRRAPAASPPLPTGAVYRSQQLFQGSDTVWIEHGSQRYALRRTRQGKLILTK